MFIKITGKRLAAVLIAGLMLVSSPLAGVGLRMALADDNPFGKSDTTDDPAFGEHDSSDITEDFGNFDNQQQSAGNPAGLVWTGFVEIEQGGHIGTDSVVDRKWVLSSRRLRLATSKANDLGSLFVKADFIEDGISNDSRLELREARIVVTPLPQVDLSIGKQVNTWGVADMLFINDLFPKNWISNFSGRDMESMKDAANSIRVTGYLGPVTVDLVYHPTFAPDTTPTGCRFAVYNPNTQSLAANADSCVSNYKYFNQPEDDSGEAAYRVKLQLGRFELAGYGYDGFFKNPKGMQWVDANGNGTGVTDLQQGQAAGYTTLASYYPRLSVRGMSFEGQLGPGILSAETGLYESPEDKDGDNPLIENAKWKYLLGYRMDLTSHFSAGLQWYQERMLDYEAYQDAVQTYFPKTYEYRKKERQNTYTLRLTFKAMQETLRIGLFHYQRPEDRDAFTKLDLTKRWNDNLETVMGANVFDGKAHYEDREFGMLRHDDNLFARIKYNF